MRLLILSPEYPPVYGGIGQHTYHLSRNLSSKKIEITVMTRSKVNNENNLKFEYVSHFRAPLFSSIFFAKHAFNYIIKNYKKFDIVHIMHPLVFFNKKQYSKIKALGIKIVSTYHGTIHDERESLRHNKRLYSIIDYFIKYFGRFFLSLEKIALENSDLNISVSKHTLKQIRNRYKYKKKVEVIYNGISVKKESHTKLDHEKKKKKKKIILFVGRLIGRKNIFSLIEMAKLFRNEKNTEIKFTIVGDGPLKKEFCERIKRNKLDNYFKLYSNLSNENLMKQYQKAYAFIFPSFYEAQGIVILEALSYKLPVIASNIGGIAEMIRNNYNGYLVKNFKPDSFHEKLKLILNNNSNYKKIKKNIKIDKKFKWDYIANKTYINYMNLIDK